MLSDDVQIDQPLALYKKFYTGTSGKHGSIVISVGQIVFWLGLLLLLLWYYNS